MTHNDSTAERLRHLLDYDPETGVFTWLMPKGKLRPGMRAGKARSKDGRRMIGIDRRGYLGSRLAWLWMKGEWPLVDLDHRDGDPINDRWDNLRLATHFENMRNRGKSRNNKSGYKGVSFHGQTRKFCARIMAGSIYRHLGIFATAEEASEAYQRAAIELHGEFAKAD